MEMNPQRKRMEKQVSFGRGVMEKQKKITMEKQRSFRIVKVMERQLSFISVSSKSPGKRGDSHLHLLARASNLTRLRDLLLLHSPGPQLLDLLSKPNQDGETPLYVAAESGHSGVVAEMLRHMDLQAASLPARNGYDPFHVAARQGHVEVVRLLLGVFPNLAMTTDQFNMTALHTAAAQGHADVVELLLEADPNLAKIARNNGKTVLHSAARMGHVEVVRSLVAADPSSPFRPDRKGQTALHMAAKGNNPRAVAVLAELLRADPALAAAEDGKGNTALHVAVAKGRLENVGCLVQHSDVNAANRAGETPLDVAADERVAAVLKEAGAAPGSERAPPPGTAKQQLKQTVSDIKHDVESQLQQTRQTRVRVLKIAKRLKKLHISGLNNAINSATVVAVLIATVAFAAIFTVPGQFVEDVKEDKSYSVGQARIATSAAFMVFFVFDSLALFISLAVVVVQTSVVVIEHSAKRQLVFVINKLLWLACIFISVAFISLTHIVVGAHSQWLGLYAALLGGSIMLATIGTMCYCVVSHRIHESRLRSESRSRSLSADSDIFNAESYNTKRMYAL